LDDFAINDFAIPLRNEGKIMGNEHVWLRLGQTLPSLSLAQLGRMTKSPPRNHFAAVFADITTFLATVLNRSPLDCTTVMETKTVFPV
jgi:hypothetical protein